MAGFRTCLRVTLACAMLGVCSLAVGQEGSSAGADLSARMTVIEDVVGRQQEIIEQQQRQIRELRSAQADAGVLAQLEKQMAERKDATELPMWLKGLKFSGDFRLRYEGLFYDDATRDVNHGRMRLRFGVEKQVLDGLVVGLRLASGGDDPTSTNQTLTGAFSKKPIWIDLAYAVYAPPSVPGLTLGGGKFKNPFVNTDMVWDSDVNPEGAFQHYTFQANDRTKPFVALGQFLVRDNAAARNANLLAIQAGCDFKITEKLTWTVAAAYYDWFNIEDPGNFLAARGNTVSGGMLTAGDFDILNITSFLAFSVRDLPAKLFADYARNLGEDAPAPDDGLDTAYAAGFVIGSNKEKGDWQLDYKYAVIEANAVVGSFTDADFVFANRKGHAIGLNYMLHKNVTARLGGFLTQPQRGPGPERTTVQADIVFKF